MSKPTATDVLPAPIVVDCAATDVDDLLGREWLLTNRIGSYASSTVIGCNCRRYHGLLVAATNPPVGRIVALATVMEQLTLAGETFDLAVNEFPGVLSPRGDAHLAEFRNDVAPTFVYRFGPVELTKQVVLAEATNAVAVRYTLCGASGTLRLRPFAAMRDFHSLRDASDPHEMTFEATDHSASVQDRSRPAHALHMIGGTSRFERDAQWWYRFYYRVEKARGQDAFEDLYSPGVFVYALADGQPVQFSANLDEPLAPNFENVLARRRDRMAELVAGVGPDADETTRRLAAASDAFVVRRTLADSHTSATILAGYHWFADWGRDAFIALPGLLLATGRDDLARQVFETFAGSVSEGMVPNRFDDYSASAHYNSIDASLWFIIAAERYLEATADTSFWRSVLGPAATAILTAYGEGTRFDIHADADGLLTGGLATTQLTWMDVALGDEAITPRHGKAVEVNALWYCAHRIAATRCYGADDALADRFAAAAQMIAASFVRTFWNGEDQCLFDCVYQRAHDATIRPNQILAVSLPYSPLTPDQQASVVRVVATQLLTPVGLRSLAPRDPRYRRRYGGSWESRDRAYHQGTVWAWLMGPFVEAYLKVSGDRPAALAQAKVWLKGIDEHLAEACLGFVSEIFDADWPHTPRGAIAQAWSVGEILRAKQLITQAERRQ